MGILQMVAGDLPATSEPPSPLPQRGKGRGVGGGGREAHRTGGRHLGRSSNHRTSQPSTPAAPLPPPLLGSPHPFRSCCPNSALTLVPSPKVSLQEGDGGGVEGQTLACRIGVCVCGAHTGRFAVLVRRVYPGGQYLGPCSWGRGCCVFAFSKTL